MRLTAEVAGGGAIGGGEVPTQHGELRVSAVDDEPVGGMIADDPADLALKFSKCGHSVLRGPMVSE